MRKSFSFCGIADGRKPSTVDTSALITSNLGVSFLPVVHLVTLQWFWKGWDSIIIGIAAVLCGLIDHRILVRNLAKSPAETSHV